jgi:hypothetical protein
LFWCGRQVLAGGYYELAAPGEWFELSLDLELHLRARTARASASGIVRAPGWISSAPIAGVVRLVGWGLCYELEFASYRFDGWLVLDGLNPVFSATRVRGLVSGPAESPRGVELRWDLRHDALTFLRGWRPAPDAGILRRGGLPR